MIHPEAKQKLVGGLEHFIFSHIGNVIIPTDFHELVFFRGVGSPHPTTNQKTSWNKFPWYFLIGAFYVGLLDGLLGVAGMMTFSSSDEMWDHSQKNSLRLVSTHQ